MVVLLSFSQEALFNLANTYNALGNDYQACAHWKKAIAVSQEREGVGYEEAHINYGLALRAKGKTEQAIYQYRAALEANPQSKEARVNLGVALAGSARQSEALEQYRETLKLDPEYEVAHFNLGLLLAEAKEWKEAASHFRACLDIEPKNGEALKHLGACEKEKGNVALAVEVEQRLDPSITVFLLSLSPKSHCVFIFYMFLRCISWQPRSMSMTGRLAYP